MDGLDAVIFDGEVRVIPRTYYEVQVCTEGVPTVIATFGNEERANGYALALHRQKALAEAIDKAEDVLLCATRFQDDPDNLKMCDFTGALEAFVSWRKMKPSDVRATWLKSHELRLAEGGFDKGVSK